MDFFNEWIVKRKRSLPDIVTIFITLLAAVFIINLLLVFSKYILAFLPIAIALVIYLAYRLISNSNIEYEYIVTNGSLDVDKIIARKSRKKVLSVNAKDFEYFAPMTEEYASVFDDKSITKRIDVSSNRYSERTYFAIFYNHGEKVCLIFEPTDKMIENFSHYISRSLNHTL